MELRNFRYREHFQSREICSKLRIFDCDSKTRWKFNMCEMIKFQCGYFRVSKLPRIKSPRIESANKLNKCVKNIKFQSQINQSSIRITSKWSQLDIFCQRSSCISLPLRRVVCRSQMSTLCWASWRLWCKSSCWQWWHCCAWVKHRSALNGPRVSFDQFKFKFRYIFNSILQRQSSSAASLEFAFHWRFIYSRKSTNMEWMWWDEIFTIQKT